MARLTSHHSLGISGFTIDSQPFPLFLSVPIPSLIVYPTLVIASILNSNSTPLQSSFVTESCSEGLDCERLRISPDWSERLRHYTRSGVIHRRTLSPLSMKHHPANRDAIPVLARAKLSSRNCSLNVGPGPLPSPFISASEVYRSSPVSTLRRLVKSLPKCRLSDAQHARFLHFISRAPSRTPKRSGRLVRQPQATSGYVATPCSLTSDYHLLLLADNA